jgi:taurine dioxygenase
MDNPHFIYRHRWNVRDVLMWDNWATVHLAVDAYSAQRIMHRISVLRAFDVPVAAP